MTSVENSMFDLPTLQRWMQGVMMRPWGAVDGPPIEEVITASRSQSSRERLDVYCHAYLARLLDCLRDEFATCCKFLGDDAFNALAAAYLEVQPSTSYNLSELGAAFPDFLKGSAQTFDGFQFLIDLATLERTYAEVFDGPGVEGLAGITPEVLRQIDPAHYPSLKFQTACCLRLLELNYPVHEFITACRHGEDPPIPHAAKTWLAVARRQFVVRRQPLCESEFRLLSLLSDGQPLGEALERVMVGESDRTTLDQDLSNWFANWTAAGFLMGVW